MKVTAYVYVTTKTGLVLLRPGDTVPEGVSVTNPAAIEAEAEKAPEAKKAPAAKAAPAKQPAPKAPASE